MDTLVARDRALGQMRPVLMKFARLQLRNETWAEDVVSETTLAALERSSSFEARSAFQTWVIGILKHKIIDVQRQMKREVSTATPVETGQLDDIDYPFECDVQLIAPLEWSDPESLMAQQQLVELMQRCIDRLPATHARAFVMREWLGYDTNEVCMTLSISTTNCNVIVFRARSQLRQHMELYLVGGTHPPRVPVNVVRRG